MPLGCKFSIVAILAAAFAGSAAGNGGSSGAMLVWGIAGALVGLFLANCNNRDGAG